MDQELERIVADAKTRYESALMDAHREYKATLAKAQETITDAIGGTNTKQPEGDPPAAVWIKAQNGEDLMVLNKQAVVMFMAIFDRMAVVSEELTKLTGKRK